LILLGNSHFKSNVLGKAGTETLSGFASITASAVTATVLTSLAAVAAGTTVTAGTNVIATAGSVAAATTITAGTNVVSTAGNVTADAGYVSGGNVRATSYVKVGNKYIFGGSVTNNESSVMYAASVALGSPSLLPGGLFLNASGGVGTSWMFDGTTTATKLVIQ